MTAEQQGIVRQIAAAAIEAERTTGCPAEITAAQCILESGYLKHAPGNNCFGIKEYAGCQGTQLLDTTEFFTDPERNHFLSRGKGRVAILVEPVRVNASGRKQYACRDAFATFATLAECFAFHGKLLQRGVYLPAWERYQKDHDLTAFIAGVAKHYATDPDYALLIGKLANGAYVAASVVQYRGRAENA